MVLERLLTSGFGEAFNAVIKSRAVEVEILSARLVDPKHRSFYSVQPFVQPGEVGIDL